MEKIIKVSIILPTYNGAEYIKRAIESVLSQSFSDWELIIINDSSVDDTENIIKKYIDKDSRIIYFKNEKNLGLQKTLNRGLKEVRGEYIARIDDDDEWIEKNKLENQIKFLENNSDYVLVGTGVVTVDENSKELYRYFLPQNDREIRKRLLVKSCFAHSSVVFKKETALKFGGYDEGEEVKHVEDYDLWLKLGTVGKLFNLPDFGTKLVLRGNSISAKNKLDQFRKNIKLSQKYRNNYPNYFASVIFNYTKLIFYKIFTVIPLPALKNKFIKIYKAS